MATGRRVERVRSRAVGMALVALAVAIASCAGRGGRQGELDQPMLPVAHAEQAEGAWVPSARASFATLGENTTYALVHDADTDLLVIDQPLLDPRDEDRVIGRATWLIHASMYAPLNDPIEFTTSDPKVYMLEELFEEPHRAVRAVGRVTIHSRTDQSMEATVNLMVPPGPATAGGAGVPRMVLVTRLELPMRVPHTPQPEPPED